MDRTKPKRRSNPNPRTERLSVAQDKLSSKVASLWFSGITQNEIAAQTGLTRKQVYESLRRSKELWREWRLDGWDAQVTAELARIDRIEAEAWAAWERSQLDAIGTVTQKKSCKDGPELLRKKSRAGQYGDGAFLRIALDCVDQRCKLLGAYDVAKIAALRQDQQDHGNTIPQGMIVVVDTPEQANHILGYTQFIEAIEKPNSM